MVRCAKTAEPVDMPFWMRTRVSPRNHALDGGVQNTQGKGLSEPFKSIGNFRCTGCCSVAAKGIIQSPIMSRSTRDHSTCQASAKCIMKISGRRRCGLSTAKPPSRSIGRIAWDCLSGCCSSSLEQPARGRHLIVITAVFPASTKDSSFSTIVSTPDSLTACQASLQWSL